MTQDLAGIVSDGNASSPRLIWLDEPELDLLARARDVEIRSRELVAGAVEEVRGTKDPILEAGTHREAEPVIIGAAADHLIDAGLTLRDAEGLPRGRQGPNASGIAQRAEGDRTLSPGIPERGPCPQFVVPPGERSLIHRNRDPVVLELMPDEFLLVRVHNLHRQLPRPVAIEVQVAPGHANIERDAVGIVD